jgi:Flp pilus assembly protein TadG
VIRVTGKHQTAGVIYLRRDSAGQSLIEIALVLPLIAILMVLAVDYGYYFIAAAALTSSARNAVEYAIQGFASPGQASPPTAGPITTSSSVAALAVGDISGFIHASTQTTVQVCSNSVNPNAMGATCQTWGATTTTWTPHSDPEPTKFTLYRVDVLYTIYPPVPGRFMGINLVPKLTFHRKAEMRAMQ